MTLRAVLFDWGGTLLRDDTVRLAEPCAAIATLARRQFGLDLDAAALDRALGDAMPPYVPGVTVDAVNIVEVIPKALRSMGHELGADSVAACAQAFFDADAAGQRLYDDARALLSSLRVRGYATAVVTNTIFPGDMLRANFGRLGVAGYIDAVVTSVDAGFGKPHPAPYERALRELNVAAEEAIFIGDRLDTDVAGALGVGIAAVLLDRGGRGSAASDVRTIERLSELNGILGEGSVGGARAGIVG